MKAQVLATSISMAIIVSAQIMLPAAAIMQSNPVTPPKNSILQPDRFPTIFEALMIADLAYACAAEADYDDAILLYKRALPTIEQQIGTNSSVYADVTAELTACYANTDQMALAEEMGMKSLTSAKQCKSLENGDRAVIANNLGYIEYRLHKSEQARQHYRYALSNLRQTDTTEAVLYAMVEANLADLAAEEHKTAEALKRYKHARAMFRRQLGKEAAMITEVERKISALQQQRRQIAKRK